MTFASALVFLALVAGLALILAGIAGQVLVLPPL